jgi:hypothetical protein
MKSILVGMAVLVASIPSQAHRLDEYLQATRIGISLEQILLALDLTPGVAIVPELRRWVQPDSSDRISQQQGNSYAQRVLKDLSLTLDGKKQELYLVSASFPAWSDIEAGEGVIHLRTTARISTLQPGSHEIFFRNDHLPQISVYLANAVAPSSEAIQIRRQSRDNLQRNYRLSFEIKAAAPK